MTEVEKKLAKVYLARMGGGKLTYLSERWGECREAARDAADAIAKLQRALDGCERFMRKGGHGSE